MIFFKSFFSKRSTFSVPSSSLQKYIDLSEEALLASEKGLKKLEVGIKNISKLTTSKSSSGFDFQNGKRIVTKL